MTERRNPEALHEAAAGWREMGKHLDGMVRELDRHVGSAAAANWHGPAGEAFAADWHRLKRSVDETLPTFELAAADLETAAAAQPAEPAPDGAAHAAPSADASSGGQSSGTQTAYGFMALGQLATSLGGAFGKRGGAGGGQRNRPPVRQEWATSTAPSGPDPFGPKAGVGQGTRGGENVAKGSRSGEGAAADGGTGPGASPRAAQRPQEPRAGAGTAADGEKGEKVARGGDGAADPAAGTNGTGAPAGASANDATAGAKNATASGKGGAAPAKEAGAEAAGPPGPDVGRHGAFG